MEVSLRKIDKDNYEAVCALEIPEHQQQNLTANVYSLLESHYYPESHRPRAIYCDDELVGFVMWGDFVEDNAENEVWIFRFMVAGSHQRRGIGRAALLKIIEEIRAATQVNEVTICYHPDNTVARDLYFSVGFKQTAMDEGGSDMLAVLNFD